MKWLTALLAVSTLAFAGGTWHFAHLLKLERERNAQVAVPGPLPLPSATPALLTPSAGPGPAATASMKAPVIVSNALTVNPRELGQLAIARRRLDDLRDPAARAERARIISSTLSQDWLMIGPRIGLSPSEVERIVADLTERQLRNMEQTAQCQLDPTCNLRELNRSPGRAQDETIASSLGPAAYARYQQFQDAWPERSMVFALNGHLPAASAVNDATGDRLVQALSEMRRQYVENAEGLGEKVEGQGLIYGSATAGSADEYVRRRESATQYASRVLQVAAGYLNADQLAALKGELDRDLYGLKDRLKNDEVSAAAKAAAGLR